MLHSFLHVSKLFTKSIFHKEGKLHDLFGSSKYISILFPTNVTELLLCVI